MKSSDESMKKKKNKILHSVFQFFPLLKINDPDVRMIYLKRQSHEIFATLIFLIALYLYRYELAKKISRNFDSVEIIAICYLQYIMKSLLSPRSQCYVSIVNNYMLIL